MEGPEPKRTLWERLGRGVAQGWEKARETGSRLGDYASLKLDLRNAREHLEGRYRLLGRIAAERLLDRGEPGVDSQDSGVSAVLDEIRAARAALEALEKRQDESRKRAPEPPLSGQGSQS